MKIVIDARLYFSGGIGTYIRGIIPCLFSSPHEIIPIYPEDAPFPIYSAKEQLYLRKKIPPCDVFWSPHYNIPLLPINAKARITTIHDVYHLDQKKHLSISQKIYAKLMLNQATKTSDHIITISEYSKDRIRFYFPSTPISVIESGCDHLLTTPEEEVENLPENFFLFVGNLKPHKNVELLFQALSDLPDAQLVIVGQTNGFRRGIDIHTLPKKYPKMKNRVLFTGTISDGQLVKLYRQATGLLFPSIYEGWGLPPLEAMSLGCPVLASNAASIPEACGNAAIYFSPESKNSLLQAIEHLPKNRDVLIEEGKQRAAKYIWQQSAQRHVQIFEAMVLSARP